MSRWWHAGAEIENSFLGLSMDGASSVGGGTGSRDTVVFRSGVASWKYVSQSGFSLYCNSPFAAVGTGKTLYSRIYLLGSTAPASACEVLSFSATANTDVTARLRTDGALELLTDSTVRGSPSSSVLDGTNWYRIELSRTLDGSNNLTAAELRVNGVTIATFSGSIAGYNPNSTMIFGWITDPGSVRTLNIDDAALNTSDGSVNNTWCGNGKVVLLKPTADSAVGTGWTTSGAASTGLFDNVDNTPPAGIADTTASNLHQIRNASSAASSYDATMTTYSAAGIVSGDVINAIRVLATHGAPAATGAKTGSLGVVSNPTIANIAFSSGVGADFWMNVVAGAYPGGWAASNGTLTEAPVVTLGTAPVMRVSVTGGTASRIALCCFMGIYVEYTPAVVATKSLVQNSRQAQARRQLTRWY